MKRRDFNKNRQFETAKVYKETFHFSQYFRNIGNYTQIPFPGEQVGNKTLIKTWNKWMEEAVLPAESEG